MSVVRLRLMLFCVCLSVGAVLSWGTWYYTNDSISYLDIARYVSAHNWSAALNPFWGLTYPWLLGLFFMLLGHGALAEVHAVRLLNITIYAATLLSFEFLLSSVLRALRHQPASEQDRGRLMLNEAAICVLGYAAFLWSALCANYVSRVSPDMLVAAIFFAASALLLRIRIAHRPAALCVSLGLLLAFGYCTKAIFGPLALVMLIVLFVVLGGSKKRAILFAMTVALWAACSAPYFAAVSSKSSGLPTAASLNYAWHVNGLWKWRHWQGGDGRFGYPLHSTRQISNDIRAYEFNGPVAGTYPPWYDPSYWYAGFKNRMSVFNEARALLRNTKALMRFLARQAAAWGLIACFVGLLWTRKRGARAWNDWAPLWPLLVCSLAGIAIYLAIYMETRYLQAMFCGLVLSVTAPLRWARGTKVKAVSAVVIAVAVCAVSISLVITLHARTHAFSFSNSLAQDSDWKLATSLGKSGILPGARVAIIGDGMRCLWAQLAEVKIIAELPDQYDEELRKGDESLFWHSSPQRRQAMLAQLAAVGATAVVAYDAPVDADTSAWTAVPTTGYFYRRLDTSVVDSSIAGAAPSQQRIAPPHSNPSKKR